MKTNREFYGKHYNYMEEVKNDAMKIIESAAAFVGTHNVRIVSRIKSPESMIKKIIGDDLPVTHESALNKESDAIGIRIIADSVSAVYAIFHQLKEMCCDNEHIRIIQVKDYIQNPKKSGYRSLHGIIGIHSGDPEFPEMKVELQLRTSIMDCWASLEHIVKYKQTIDVTPKIYDMLKVYREEAEQEIHNLSSFA